ncbi:hypothetical protein HK098_000920 [Nowakowskiella sp. JEL0407]|nr:hypothetical protein HK098_000920 [Nowakowskiella sp. JEL0407]
MSIPITFLKLGNSPITGVQTITIPSFRTTAQDLKIRIVQHITTSSKTNLSSITPENISIDLYLTNNLISLDDTRLYPVSPDANVADLFANLLTKLDPVPTALDELGLSSALSKHSNLHIIVQNTPTPPPSTSIPKILSKVKLKTSGIKLNHPNHSFVKDKLSFDRSGSASVIIHTSIDSNFSKYSDPPVSNTGNAGVKFKKELLDPEIPLDLRRNTIGGGSLGRYIRNRAESYSYQPGTLRKLNVFFNLVIAGAVILLVVFLAWMISMKN